MLTILSFLIFQAASLTPHRDPNATPYPDSQFVDQGWFDWAWGFAFGALIVAGGFIIRGVLKQKLGSGLTRKQ